MRGGMNMNNDKMMLVYRFDFFKTNKLKEIAKKNKLPDIKVVTDEMTSMTVKDIIQGYRFEIVQEKIPNESAIVFNNFDDRELDTAISEIRKKLGQKIILAVVTQTSIEWAFKDLIEHLIEERDFFKKYRGK